MSDTKLDISQWHLKQAKSCFNTTWDLIEKENPTEVDISNMINTCHASLFHWTQVGQPINLARGEWQLSRVYAIVGMAESSLFHAKNSYKICMDNDIEDFDLSFAYEALSRAYHVMGQNDPAIEYYNLALESANDIKKDEDKKYFLSELESINN